MLAHASDGNERRRSEAVMGVNHHSSRNSAMRSGLRWRQTGRTNHSSLHSGGPFSVDLDAAEVGNARAEDDGLHLPHRLCRLITIIKTYHKYLFKVSWNHGQQASQTSGSQSRLLEDKVAVMGNVNVCHNVSFLLLTPPFSASLPRLLQLFLQLLHLPLCSKSPRPHLLLLLHDRDIVGPQDAVILAQDFQLGCSNDGQASRICRNRSRLSRSHFCLRGCVEEFIVGHRIRKHDVC